MTCDCRHRHWAVLMETISSDKAYFLLRSVVNIYRELIHTQYIRNISANSHIYPEHKNYENVFLSL